MKSKKYFLDQCAKRQALTSVYMTRCDEEGRIPELDPVCWGQIQISMEDHKRHTGALFVFKEGITLNNSSKEYLITIPDSHLRFHFWAEIQGSLDTSYELIENTQKVGGVLLTMLNKERYASGDPHGGRHTQAGFSLTHSPTGSNGSVIVLESGRFGSALHSSGMGGSGGIGITDHTLGKPDGKYLLKVQALSVGINNITVKILGYEAIHKG